MDNYWAHHTPNHTPNHGFLPYNPNPATSQTGQHQPKQHPNSSSDHLPPPRYVPPAWNTQAESIALSHHRGSQPGLDHTHRRSYLPSPQIVPSQGSSHHPQYPSQRNMSTFSGSLHSSVQHDRLLEPRESLDFVPRFNPHEVGENPTPNREVFHAPLAGNPPSPPPPHPLPPPAPALALAPPPAPAPVPAPVPTHIPVPTPATGHPLLAHRAPDRGSDSDSSLPSPQDIGVPSSTPRSKSQQTKTPKRGATASGSGKNTTTKSKSKATGKAKVNEEDTGSSKWSEEDWDALFTFILDVEERNFDRAERKGDNKSFWDMVSLTGLHGKWDGVSARSHWKIGRMIYSIIRELESFTGGDGDGDEDARFDEDDDKATALEKLQRRLEIIQNRKPNIDPHRKVKPEIYYNWVRGGEDSWYLKMHQRFKDSKTAFTREIERGSGRLETSDDSDDTRSDSTPSSRKAQRKQSQPVTVMEGMVSMVKGLHDSRKATADIKESVAQQRLEFEKERAKLADTALLKKADNDEKLLNFRIEAAKRKWAVEDKAYDAEQLAKRRREDLEDQQQKQNLILNQIKTLESLISKPDTDAQLKESLRARVTILLDKLGGD